MPLEDMKPLADDVAELMKTLAHANRLLALCAIMDNERSVGKLAEDLGMRTQAMSQQLAILRNKGLVKTRRDGQTIYYSLADDRLHRLISTLYDTYCRPAA
jgi:DNA-binding transcriptional ArsR family regulator